MFNKLKEFRELLPRLFFYILCVTLDNGKQIGKGKILWQIN